MEARIYRALLDGIRNTSEYKLGHIDVIYTNCNSDVIVVPGEGKDCMNVPACINIAFSMGLFASLRVLDNAPAIYIY
jgi:3-dehydroquinate synthase class II